MRITNRNRLTAIIVLAVLTLGATCQGAYQGAVVTATNLDNQFSQTGALMDRLAREQRITWIQYEPWARFAPRYQLLSDTAYRTIKASKDAKSVDQAVAIINGLEAEIAMYFLFANEKK